MLECCEQGFRIGVAAPRGREALCVKLRAQLGMVVDFSIEGDHKSAGAGTHWLCPSVREVDDGEPPVAEGGRAFATVPVPFRVRTPVTDGVRHASRLREHCSRVAVAL